MGTPARGGHLCPVCIRPAGSGTCPEHGPWEPHQLLTRDDRVISWLPAARSKPARIRAHTT